MSICKAIGTWITLFVKLSYILLVNIIWFFKEKKKDFDYYLFIYDLDFLTKKNQSVIKKTKKQHLLMTMMYLNMKLLRGTETMIILNCFYSIRKNVMLLAFSQSKVAFFLSFLSDC